MKIIFSLAIVATGLLLTGCNNNDANSPGSYGTNSIPSTGTDTNAPVNTNSINNSSTNSTPGTTTSP